MTSTVLSVPFVQAGHVVMTVAISACGPRWACPRLRGTASHSSTARFVLLIHTEANMTSKLYMFHHSVLERTLDSVLPGFPSFPSSPVLILFHLFEWNVVKWWVISLTSPSGHLHASCVLRSRRRPWPLCLMAWLAFSCWCAIGAQCHARAPCTTPSTPSLWSVQSSAVVFKSDRKHEMT